MAHPFRNRREAGRALARVLAQRLGDGGAQPVVLALPRGGVPVAFEVAAALGAPLDIVLVRKLGTPGHEELAMGAVAAEGEPVLIRRVVEQLLVDQQAIEREVALERAELVRRESAYRHGRPVEPVAGRTAIVIDDGLATGASMRAALGALRMSHPERLVVAVPVAASEACRELESEADTVICLHTPDPFDAVGVWYDDFEPVTDDEVRSLLDDAAARFTRRAS